MMEKSTRILAVDDSITIRKALELILLPAGYVVEFAVDGGEAIGKAKTFHPDIVLLDFILPDMRGTEVCRALAADAQMARIPIVLISARGAEIRQAYNDVDNVVDYITKPFTPDEVIGVITEVESLLDERAAGSATVTVAGSDGAAAMADTAADLSPQAATALAGGEEAADDWDGSDDGGEEIEIDVDLGDARPRSAHRQVRRSSLEVVFETLRAGLEGVYVEEVDTPGAMTDQAKSYTQLASVLAQQLRETLQQAESGMPFRLCSDGSVRSLYDSLLDAHRRFCRLLFRAGQAAADPDRVLARPRLLVVCQRDSELLDTWSSAARRRTDWHLFLVSSSFRQLPLMTRLYAPTHVVVEGGCGNAVWDQLKTLRRMPEGRRIRFIGVVTGDTAVEEERFAALQFDGSVAADADIVERLRDVVLPAGRVAADDLTEAPSADTGMQVQAV
jgi:CheY-like chemotaxis protein